jgi:uncharacterized protein (DUF1015 family)
MTTLADRVEPFAALVYNPHRAGPLASLLAPPYDLIGPEQQDKLYARSPYNVVRLELNRDADPYDSAARTLTRWQAEGIVERAARPAIYHYTQRFAVEGRTLRRRALIARVGLEEFQTGRILPHERTFPKAKEDRLRLLEATHTNISSIFGLCPATDAGLGNLFKEVARREPQLAATDDLGIVNEIRVIDDFEEIALVQRALEAPRILIADGHHRYETALEYYRRDSHGRAGTPRPPAAYTMMTLVAFDDAGLVILPTHRVVLALPADAITAFATRCGRDFTSEEFSSADRFLAVLQAGGRGAIGVALRDARTFRILRLRGGANLSVAMPDVRAAVRDLEVTILHTLIFERIFGIKAEEVRKGGNIEYTVDAHGALAHVSEGKADGAFLMNPPTIRDIERVSSAGATMPEKSTYFFPKLITGLVMNPLED